MALAKHLRRWAGLGSIAWLLAFTPPAAAQNANIDSKGDCNVNVTGSDNSSVINCTIIRGGDPQKPPPETEVDVVVNFQGGPTIQTWYVDGWGNYQVLNPDMSTVDQFNSYYRLVLDDTPYDFSLTDRFEGDFQRLKVGKHRYSMRTEIVYWNGFVTRADCRGIVDIQSEANLVPKQHIQVYPDGQISSIQCGFIANR